MWFLLYCNAGYVLAQLPPKPKGITVLKSKFHENITISYKEPGICETTPGVKSYSGYVHLPPGTLDDEIGEPQDYPINTFFWFFEARKTPEQAPLAIWLNGGPGGPSMVGLLEELGPCFVSPDSKGTYLNPWSWNNEVNMLFIDQPNQVGFSYDVSMNGTLVPLDPPEGEIDFYQPIIRNFTDGVPKANLTHYPGTFSSQKASGTQGTTQSAAHALWHFAQTWFFEFPHHKPEDNKISLWAESYGGHYGPGFFRFFQRQNDRIRDGSSREEGAHYLHLDTLGIVNGGLDTVVQGEFYPEFAYNNTYGIQIINESEYNDLKDLWTKPGGCKDRVLACQAALRDRDGPAILSSVLKNVTEICGETVGCLMLGAKQVHARDVAYYDIAHPAADPFPLPYLYGYLTEESVLSALGVPVNFTFPSWSVQERFTSSFDLAHGGFIEAVAYLLDAGVKVHMMYGDRDFSCNWLGGEAASLAVEYSAATSFAAAGYAPLITSEGVSGMIRQYGNFSFSRVFDAGHEVPAYKPIAAYEIFMRATFNRDIATGLLPVTDDLTTVGPSDVRSIKNLVPEKPMERCYILKPNSCTPETWKRLLEGNVTVRDWFVIDDDRVMSQPNGDGWDSREEL